MAFQTALSGLNAASGNLNVTGHNIANASTTGFKKSRADFADVYAVSFGGVSKTATGSGVRLASVTQQFTQGNIDFTDNNLDLAISGEGFFVLNDNGTFLYSRAGNFSVDRDGYVVNAHGQRVQQYAVDPNTGIVSNFTPTDLQLNLGANPASPTTRIDINVNLDAGVTPIDSTAYPALVAAPVPDPNTYNFSTTTTIYDSLGVTHEATLYFRKDDTMPANEWEATLAITDIDGTINVMDTVTVQFSSNGTLLTTGDQDFLATSGPWTPSTGAAPFTTFDINFAGSTQFGANSAVNALSQDGYTTGRLSGISVDSNGVLFARYTNGQSSTVGAIAMARFSNPNGLQQVGDTNWAATFESGDVLPGQAGTGTFGQIQSGALEASNVDISKQLVNMIIAQRDFQANAKMITTEDQVTQTIINIR
ncbi:flagellar hook protein FlgE [Sulfurivermis fontis]|uniref:flagellar hook protein FlgE n=1 Tax=Sulfurivermis fontis TaxID=1972068 RepID=UPI000FDBAABD|nr:flagellar hook protein FlgE [Sulfurivermis fontis]